MNLYNVTHFKLGIIIIIIILSCRQHGYPWPSLAIPPYSSSLLAGPQGYIPYPHRAAVSRFELITLLLLGHMSGSIGEHHLWARPCFSSNVLHVCISCMSNFDSFRGGRQVNEQLLLCGVLPPGLVQNWASLKKKNIIMCFVIYFSLLPEIFCLLPGRKTNAIRQ